MRATSGIFMHIKTSVGVCIDNSAARSLAMSDFEHLTCRTTPPWQRASCSWMAG